MEKRGGIDVKQVGGLSQSVATPASDFVIEPGLFMYRMKSEEVREMYCSSCGSAVMQGVSFCRRCGAQLSGANDEEIAETSATFPESLIWAIVAVFVVGLGAAIALIAVMKNLDFNPALTIAFPIVIFLLMLAIEGVFIWKYLSPRRRAKKVPGTGRLQENASNELGAVQTSWITDAVPSVTEHTTHTFEPIHSDPK